MRLPAVRSLTTAPLTVYKVSAPADRGIVQMIRAVNIDTISRTVNVYLLIGGISVQYSSKNQAVDPGAMILETDTLELGVGDSILASCSADGVVDLTISGYEVDKGGKRVTS